MRSMYMLVMGAMLLLSMNGVAQKIEQPYQLGSAGTFLKNVRAQITSPNQRAAQPGFTIKTSPTESLSLLVNADRKTTVNEEYLIGEVANSPSSSFILKGNTKNLEGNIILKKENRAFEFYTDKSGNAFVREVPIGSVICVNYATAPAEALQASPGVALDAVNLQSFPGARGCVLLDFDGQYVSGTPWNGGNPINAAPSGLSDAAMTELWEVVSEDYRPFHINVTTNEAVFNTYARTMRMRVIITPTNTAAPGSGGVAYIGSFNWNDDTPCWVFVLAGKGGGEAASHEVGHTFGLGHDGRTNPSEGYFAGHGNWAPIMGVGYYKPITQWSKGEYNFSNNKEDDLAKISSATYNVGFRNDDYGNSTSAAATIVSGSVSKSGLIERTSDIDFFSFNSGSGTINLTVNTVSRHGDLDVLVKLYNSGGAVIGTYNPAGLNSSLSASVSAGTYYLSVDGTGTGNPATDGYSDYASLGSYTISGTIPVGTSSNVATVYKDCNYTGTAVGLPVGEYNLTAMIARGILNDDISSIQINAGYQMIIYQHDNFGGTNFTVTANNSCLVDEGWNDLTSSIRIAATARAGRESIVEETSSQGEELVAQVSPNPFQGEAKISVALPTLGYTEVSIFSGMGSKVSDLHKGVLESGLHEFNFNAENAPSGLYIYRIMHNGKRITGKLLRK